MFTVAREPMQMSRSPITWFVSFLLMGGAVLAAVLFLRVDLGLGKQAKAAVTQPVAVKDTAVPTAQEITVLIVAMEGKVQIEEFGSMEKCSEAATYIRLGTDRRIVAQCVTK